MQFNSYSFLVFVLYVFAVHFSVQSWRVKKLNLLFASFLFYAAWQPAYILLLAFSTVLDWYLARALAAAEDERKRKFFLLISLVANLGLLGVFKYADFTLQSVASLLGMFGVEWDAPTTGLLLPVGISFYTFQTLSYTIDVYRRSMKPASSFLDYSLYVAFFPQLVAGPIVRASSFLPQCKEYQPPDLQRFGIGVALFLVGLWEKAVLADGIFAPAVEATYNNASNLSFVEAWCGTMAFAGQILCDFAGYSSCAIGVAKCLGFDLPMNFRFPYAAIGFSDFWRRWHISLSSWLRDYLFVALGSSRGGRWFTARNLMLTMVLGGLWHGAAWNFVIWGALHGLYLGIENALKRMRWAVALGATLLGKVLAWVVTMIALLIAYVFFRARTLEDSVAVLRSMFGGADRLWEPFGDGILLPGDWTLILAMFAFVALVAFNIRQRWRTTEQFLVAQRWPLMVLYFTLMLVTIALMSGQNRAFIYFQF